MPFTQFTNLDFDQIKVQIKDHLRSNSNFTDFDFEGSNFSVLIDTLAYNTYINAFNANLVVNESFLDSATVRENVVSLARNIGYVPRSKTAAVARIKIEPVELADPTDIPYIRLRPGLVCVGTTNNTTYRFSLPEEITSIRKDSSGKYIFDEIDVYEGTFLSSRFGVISPQTTQQRFILDNSNIDTTTIRVKIGAPGTVGRAYNAVDNILSLNKNSEIYLLQEVQDEKYELLFGDGLFGKQLTDGDIINVSYIITDGQGGNGPANFSFQGTFMDHNGFLITPNDSVVLTTVNSASNGGEAESVSSIKYFAPRLYSAQYRAVTSRDYEAIISSIYPKTESVAVIGGEELDPPQFGKVQISIKPKNGTYVSDFDKQQIKSKLKSYSIAGINSEIIDLKVIYVELHSTVYYDSSKVPDYLNLKSVITDSLTKYSNNVEMNKFGGRFKYSKINQLIDRVHEGITSNITKVIIRRDLKASLDSFAQYELCFGNRFHINPEGFNIKSTGFTISGSSKTVYITDVPNKKSDGSLDGTNMGTLSVVSTNERNEQNVIQKEVGTVDYKKGEIILNTINITSTVAANNIVEIQAFPESNDVIGFKDLYLSFDVSNTTINMVRDVIASGEDVSGVVFARDYYTSSYSNGVLERI